eukprot:2506467-Alexandrium_andersonii.AAC.1
MMRALRNAAPPVEVAWACCVAGALLDETGGGPNWPLPDRGNRPPWLRCRHVKRHWTTWEPSTSTFET